MGFFGELKQDLSQAVNELIDDDSKKTEIDDFGLQMVDLNEQPENPDLQTDDFDFQSDELKMLDDALEAGYESKPDEGTVTDENPQNSIDDMESDEDLQKVLEEALAKDISLYANPSDDDATGSVPGTDDPSNEEMSATEDGPSEEIPSEEIPSNEEITANKEIPANEDISVNTELFLDNRENADSISETEFVSKFVAEPVPDTISEECTQNILQDPVNNTDKPVIKGAKRKMGNVSDETSVITPGMTVTGNIEAEGSLSILGTVTGNVDVSGKLEVMGHINGDLNAHEFFAENAKITGNINSETSVKVGAGTVIVGNINATSAAIAGAIKGDIDVHGPVIIDSSAIVMGNIKSKSVQINNGAAVEGNCSQCYAETNPISFFNDYKQD